jgi:hypothetical protein
MLRNLFVKSVLVVLSFSVHDFVSAQDLHISTKTENIQIINDTLFTRNITVLFNQSSEETIFPIFYDYKLERISDIEVYIKRGNRFKLLQNPVIHTEDVDLELISSKKVKSISIPSEDETKITYTVSCNELRYFSDLPLFTYYDIDTLNYQINVPGTYNLFYDKLYTDSLKYMVIDSSKFNNQTIWYFKTTPVKVKPDLMLFFGIYRNMRAPIIRTTVIPGTSGNNKREFLNNWYFGNVAATRGLNSSAIGKIDEITDRIVDSVEIINILYDYVRANFKYVADEIGMGAFIPSHVNEVFISKQGDCKDLSNFLCEALNYKGIKSYIALAATFHHICDCDFPSICSANHVICVAYLNNKPVILDPTDPIHTPGTPVQSIQDRTILIINPSGGEYYKLNRSAPQSNVIDYDVELNVDSDKSLIEGEFNVNYTGISGNFLEWMFYGKTGIEKEDTGRKYYKSVFNNQTISALKVNCYSDTVKAEGKLSIDLKIFEDNDNRYFFPDFLPRLIESERQETLVEGTFLGNTIDKRVKLVIKMDEPFEAFSRIEHTFSDKGISLNMEIANPVESVIECNYEFILDHIFVTKENLNPINDILKSYKKLINEPIVLKNKN